MKSNEIKNTESTKTMNSCLSIRPETKELFDSKWKFSNEKDSKKKISRDDFFNFLLGLATDEEIRKYQLSTLTWEEEEPRLIELWEKKKKKKVTSSEWAIMFRKGLLDDFIIENSRVPLLQEIQ